MNAHANLRSQQKDYVCLISYGLEQIHKNVMAIVPTKALLTFQQFITVTIGYNSQNFMSCMVAINLFKPHWAQTFVLAKRVQYRFIWNKMI